jgi:hypothetical protein
MELSLADPLYSKFNGKLSAIGWTPQMLVDSQVALAAFVDSSHAGEMAMGKAAMRSQTKLYVGTTDSTITTEYSGQSISIPLTAGNTFIQKLRSWAGSLPRC